MIIIALGGNSSCNSSHPISTTSSVGSSHACPQTSSRFAEQLSLTKHFRISRPNHAPLDGYRNRHELSNFQRLSTASMSPPIVLSPQWHQVVASRGRSSVPSNRSTTRSRSCSPQRSHSPSHSVEISRRNSPSNETETPSLSSYRSRSPSPPRSRYYKQAFSDITALTVQLLLEEEMWAEDCPRRMLDVAEEVIGE